MLHELWGEPAVERVATSVSTGLGCDEQVVVVGIKAAEVARVLGKRIGRLFAYQESLVTGQPAGTGDAVMVALQSFAPDADRDVYVFLGDMALLTPAGVASFRKAFEADRCDMLILTGAYTGPAEQNYYGRIVRVPARDESGASSGADAGKVIEILEYQDVLSLGQDERRVVEYSGRRYSFERDDLLGCREINTGVFAFAESSLRESIEQLNTDNAQGEYLLTDIVDILNRGGRVVRAVMASSEEEILAFNTKSVLRQMEDVARHRAYEQLMDVVTIADPGDFFIATSVVEELLRIDAEAGPLEIVFGKGVHVGAGVRLAPCVTIGDRSRLSGQVSLGAGTKVGRDCSLDAGAYEIEIDQAATIGDRVTLHGAVHVGSRATLGDGIRVSGTGQARTSLGDQCLIAGRTHVESCLVAAGARIEHCLLVRQRVATERTPDGNAIPIRYQQPAPKGTAALSSL